MGRKNRRKKSEYKKRLGFNPRKYMRQDHAVKQETAMHTGRVEMAAAEAGKFGQIGWTGQAGQFGQTGKVSKSCCNATPHRGDIWFADLGCHPGTSVQGGCRPVLVISNDKGNARSETINVLPMTSHLKKPGLPCHFWLESEHVTDVQRGIGNSMLLAEQITTIGKNQLRHYVGKVEDAATLERICRTILEQLSLMVTQL